MNKIFIVFLFFICVNIKAPAQYIRDHFSVGIGPSMIYADNAGAYRSLKFKVMPSLSAGYNYQINDWLDIKATLGVQQLNSGGYDPIASYTNIQWGDSGQAFDFKGFAYFGDLMPVYHFNPNRPGVAGDVVSFYAGVGIGLMQVNRDQKVLVDGSIEEDRLISGHIEQSKQFTTAAYIPFRIGLGTNLESDWEYVLEFSALTSMDSNIDGNNQRYKTLKPDILFQFQVMVKRYIGN